jgi:capsular polysaccharide biosynthesis protein
MLITVSILVGVASGYLITPRTTLYRATALLYVGERQLQSNPTELYALPGLNQILFTFTQMIPNPVITQKAVSATGIPRSADQVSSETKATDITGSNLISVAVTDTDPLVAQRLANSVSDAFVSQIQHYEPGASAGPGTVPLEPAYVFQEASLPVAPLSSGLSRHLALGGIFGFVVAVAIVLLLDYLDITVRTPEDLESKLGLTVLGVIPLRTNYVERTPVA